LMQPINMEMLFNSVFEELMVTTDWKIDFKVLPLKPSEGDKSMITQLITNLVSNAIKYSGKESAPEIIVSGGKMKNNYVYSIKDNGVGFNMTYVNKLFGVFQRLHKEKDFKGTGVGLAISKRIVVQHEGEIWADSQLNQGTTFYFTLNNKND
jgi:light-regulated signal transduction histidine kinase (bacteriophytochrome)